ncbi:MAG: macro domain-containing protein [Chitinivibrionales bacterium]|nr:macro domain-containing protein [Chitinivibrionales bacterium]
MITVKIGNLFSSSAQTLVNTVNCVGVMGKGIALEAKKRFPSMFADYEARCQRHEVKLGRPYLYKQNQGPWIVNFPTKGHWRAVSNIQDIEEGLRYLKDHYKEWGITSLAMPPLGCGNGQLEWRVVKTVMHKYLNDFDIPIELYAPFETPQDDLKFSLIDSQPSSQKIKSESSRRLEPSLFALVEIVNRIEHEPYYWPIGRVIFQKIAYFATQTGIPTGLKYQRGSYGPYSAELKKNMAILFNNGLLKEEELGRMLTVKVGSAYTDSRQLYEKHVAQWEAIIDKIVDLFTRMNTTQAEIAATVHFAANELRQSTPDRIDEMAILKSVMQWKQKRRPPLNERDVAKSIRELNILSWLEAKASMDLPIEEEEFLSV